MSEQGLARHAEFPHLPRPHRGSVVDADTLAAALLAMGEGRGSRLHRRPEHRCAISLAAAASRKSAAHMDLRYDFGCSQRRIQSRLPEPTAEVSLFPGKTGDDET